MTQAEMDARAERVADAVRPYEARGEFARGTADGLGRMWSQSYGSLGPAQLASKVAEQLSSPAVRERWSDPEFVEPPAPSGAPASPLRVAVRRLAGQLREGVEENLVAELQGKLGHVSADPSKLAGALAGMLQRRDFAERWARVAPEAPESERRLSELLRTHFPDVDVFARDRIARDRGAALARIDDVQAVRTIAKTLATPGLAARYGAAPLASDDARQNFYQRSASDGPTTSDFHTRL